MSDELMEKMITVIELHEYAPLCCMCMCGCEVVSRREHAIHVIRELNEVCT